MLKFFSALKVKLCNHKRIIENFSYISLLQIYLLLVPMLTYPHLTKVLGMDLYGIVIISQVLASYCSVLVDFGFKSVSARHISINRDNNQKLSEILSTILTIRFGLWIVTFLLYFGLIIIVDSYSQHMKLFLFAYFITFNELLFPQFFFQGIERMKLITIVNMIARTIFIILIFVFVKDKMDYLYVPLYTGIGSFVGGVISLFIIKTKYNIRYILPSLSDVKYYTKDAFPVFATDAICTIKDKMGYLFIGKFIGVEDVVIYDLGVKFVGILSKPANILKTVVFPRLSNKWNLRSFCNYGYITILITLIPIIIINTFMPKIVFWLTHEELNVFPIRVYTFGAILLTMSIYVASCFFLARGYNKYLLHSIIITTVAYIIALVFVYVFGLNSVLSIFGVAIFALIVELIYRLFMLIRINKN